MTNNTKPSDWAYRVWEEASNASFVAPAGPYAAEAAALIIEQARKEWEAELCEMLRGLTGRKAKWSLRLMLAGIAIRPLAAIAPAFLLKRLVLLIVREIERGEHRKDKP